MPKTRATKAVSDQVVDGQGMESDSQDELDITTCEQRRTVNETTNMAAILADVVKQLGALRAEVSRRKEVELGPSVQDSAENIIAMGREGGDANKGSSDSTAAASTPSAREAGITLAGALSELSRTLSNTRPEEGRRLYDLPIFDGQPEDWPMFRESFQITTEEYRYSNRQNLMRLQKALKGKAKEAVECLLIHSSNVPRIIDTLKGRFGRPDQLVKSQIGRIREVAPISDNRIEQLVPFATKVQNLSSFLKAAECEQHLANPTLMEELLLKLSVQRRLDWARYAMTLESTPTIEQFSDWLQELSKMVSIACTDLNEPQQNDGRRGKRTQFFLASDVANNSSGCKLCGAAHEIESFRRFGDMTYGQRWRCTRRYRLCFNCLEAGHRTDSCTKRHKCDQANCTKRLHKLLHGSLSETTGQTVGRNHQPQVFTNKVLPPVNTKLLFKILPVRLYGKGRVITCYAFIDEGSAISLVNKRLADRLGLQGPEENLTMQWFGDNTITQPSSRVSMEVSGVKQNSRRFQLRNIRTVRDLRLPTQTLDLTALHSKYRHVKQIPINDYHAATPELLIGLDNAHLGVPRKVVAEGWKSPTVVLTKLGWVVYGKEHEANEGNYHAFFAQVPRQDQFEELVNNYIMGDDLGTRTVEKVKESVDTSRAKELLNATTKRLGTQFETGLLWKSDSITLPESRKMAVKRFLSLEKKFMLNNSFRDQYTRIMLEYERKGYARKLTESERSIIEGRTWYLPHFAVANPNKPGKLRLVFDAAAQVGGISLNSVLLSGPDECQPLTAVLMKFRQRPIGVCADIVEMFHQVKIRQEDQIAQRFVWRTDPREPIGEYVMTSMTFGATCSPCSAQFVKNRNAEEFRAKYPVAVDAIKNNHYVDDFVHCFETEREAVRVSREVIWIQKQGGFELKRFVSNSKRLMKTFEDNEDQFPVLNLDKSETKNCQKVLGMHWDTSQDMFKFIMTFAKIDPALLNGTRKPTKREMLSIVMSVFDPFGLVAEYTLMAKLALQSVWRQQVDWDAKIPDEGNMIWLRWLDRLKEIEDISVPRYYGIGFTSKPIELHIFCDASEQAFAAAAYWRIPNEDGTGRLAFVVGKTKCAPLKLTSIPRLELQSAVLATRLREIVLLYHNITPNRIVMWCDSKTALSWICSDQRRYNLYVAHRVSEILDTTKIAEWRWLPSALNPADFGTRMKERKRESFWLEGPNFLKKRESEWPPPMPTTKTEEELRRKAAFLLIDNKDIFQRFSDFKRLKRIIAWILRFRRNCLNESRRECGGLKVNELEKAEMTICRVVQMAVYADDYRMLEAGKTLNRTSSLLRLTPMLDKNGVMRMCGRIDEALTISVHARRPIILPQHHRVTALIVDSYHHAWKHQNEGTIIAEIRRRFWIPHIRTVVRQAARRCQTCKRERAKPENPPMGQLPVDRLTPFVRPFSYVGIDYMGPFFITTGRRNEKRWIALFTCLTVRAVHLEIARDLTTDTCLMCIRNFINRRGIPVRIRTDNATNFVGANAELKRQLNQLDHGIIRDALANQKIEWVFNCPLNPHAGGCWERLVRSIKRAMGHALYNETLQEHSLYSLAIEAENMVNSRPLTHIALDTPTDEPITPNHFLLGVPNSEQTPHPREEEFRVTRKHWRRVQQIQHRFWNKWITEYLPDLCRRTKWYQPVKPLAVDDIVLVCDKSIHRSKWPVGRIIQVFMGKDSQVRTAEVWTRLGNIRRPACMLAKLEVSESGTS